MNKVMLLAGMLMVMANVSLAAENAIADGKKVKFEYTLKVDGAVVESSKGQEPLEYEHGQNQIVPGLEKALTGMKVGQEKSVTIAPADAYGEINKEAFREFPKTSFPEDLKPEVGMVIELEGPEGQKVPAVIWEIKDENVVLNFNHPLAGKTLNFDVKIVSVE